MPAPQASMLSQLSKTNFIGKNIVLPVDWKNPGPQYGDAFPPDERSVPPNPPMTLFRSATLNKLHVQAAKERSDEFTAYIDGISKAICFALDMWLKQATISGVLINGPVGMLTPGCVKGPVITSYIQSRGPKGTPLEARYTKAIANSIGPAWQQWSMGLMGTLQYPAFAAVPAPVAPPMPNIPIPVMMLSSPGESMLAAGTLSKTIMANFGDPSAAHCQALFDAVAFGFFTVFNLFKTTTMVQNVLGTGPVPVYAPPFVPVGPVVAGTGTGAPGCLV